MNYRNIDDLNHCILQHLSILPRDFDLIVGVPRSGMFPANLLALYLNLPVTDIDSFRNGHIYQTGERGKTFNMTHIHKVSNTVPFMQFHYTLILLIIFSK